MGDIYSAENAHEWNSEILRLIAHISHIKQDFSTPSGTTSDFWAGLISRGIPNGGIHSG